MRLNKLLITSLTNSVPGPSFLSINRASLDIIDTLYYITVLMVLVLFLLFSFRQKKNFRERTEQEDQHHQGLQVRIVHPTKPEKLIVAHVT
jgi:heme/copper-type cytochrome/quinol oxidase subunit 2